MGDPVAQLTEMVARLRKLEGGAKLCAPDVAKALKVQLLANAAAGVGPDGTPWPATKDGHQPLTGAASHLSVEAVGTRIVARLSGHYVNQSIGWTRGNVARPIMPTRKLSQPMTQALEAVITKRIGAILRGD